uniref:Uncharacterized protein n=1 Tax=Setaria digitata TaxID=48799 RepID=A0A915PZD3_9BILA
MADNIKTMAEEEEEEEEEEGSVTDMRHRRFVYKVRFVQSPDHPTTSETVVQNASFHSSSSSSNMMKMDESRIDASNSSEHFNDESMLSRNNEHLASSAIKIAEENHMPTFNESEKFLSSKFDQDLSNYQNDYQPEQAFKSSEQFQQLDASYEGQLSDMPTSTGTTFDDNNIIVDYTFNDDFNTSFNIPKNFESTKTDIIHYDEFLSGVLSQENSISGIQHAPLFGSAVENLFNFANSKFDLIGGTDNADDINVTVTDNHSSENQVITGLAQNGQVIFGGLSVPIIKELNSSQKIASSTLYKMNPDEGTVSISMSQILQDLDGQYLDVKHEIITGLTAHGELIVANTTDNSSETNARLLSVIMGLTASGQIICGGCISDIIPKCEFTTSEKSLESSEQHTTLDIIANLTAKNEKVLCGLADVILHSPLTDTNNGSLLRRDSF